GDIASLINGNLMAKLFGKIGKSCQSIQVRLIMDPIHKGIFALVFMKDEFSHRFIGQQHKFLDLLVAIFPLFDYQTYGSTLFIQLKFYFLCLKVDRALLESSLPQFLCKFIQKCQLFIKISLLLIDVCLRLFICKPPIGMDNGSPNPMVKNVRILVELEHT